MSIVSACVGVSVVVFTTGRGNSRELEKRLVEKGYDAITVHEEMPEQAVKGAVDVLKSGRVQSLLQRT